MKTIHHRLAHTATLIMTFVMLFIPSYSLADESLKAEIQFLKERLAALESKLVKQEEKTEIIAEEVADNKIAQIIPEKAELKSEWGLGPAASSVYHVKKGLSIGGYGEAYYRDFVDDDSGKKDQSDFHRFITYIGYKFNDWIILNSEIEYEHGTTSGIGDTSGDKSGSVSVEFAYLDFMFNESINARAGTLLVPMGFLNELHEPSTYHGVRRPEVESRIIPTTWRENGFGIFGKLSEDLEYRSYIVNGLRASRFSDTGIRGGRQKGNRALTEDIAWVTRMDYTPDFVEGLQVGGSFYIGNSGQDETFGTSTPDVRTIIGEVHGQYHNSGLELRALGAWVDLDDADVLSAALGETIGDSQNGFYVEAAYNILPDLDPETTHYLAPFFRYEQYDTHAGVPSGFTADESLDKEVFVFGMSYRPIPSVVIKADYKNFETDGSSPTADEVGVGVGFAF